MIVCMGIDLEAGVFVRREETMLWSWGSTVTGERRVEDEPEEFVGRERRREVERSCGA